jgi:soluble lytic murein transglycosylase
MYQRDVILRRRKWLLLIVAMGAMIFGGWLWYEAQREASQDDVIRAAASRYEIDPALVKAVVWRESRFNPLARGRAQEIGLMQLREEAAQEWADAERIEGFVHEHCFSARTNVLAGAFYLKKLLRRYRNTDNPVPYALADYNAGRANVLKWNRGTASTNSTDFIAQIGFPGTKQYVQAVMRRTRRYQTWGRIGFLFGSSEL